MKLRVHQDRPLQKYELGREEDARREKSGEAAIDQFTNGDVRGDFLQMQQTHGNAAVRRYLAKLGYAAGSSVQREGADQQKWGNDEDIPNRTGTVLLTVNGAKQGQFKGETTIVGQEGKIECSTVDVSTKGADEKATTTVRFDMVMDKSTQQFFQALNNGEAINTMRIEMGSISPKGTFKPFHVMDLQTGHVTGVQFTASHGLAGDTSSRSSREQNPEMARITMVMGPYARSAFLKK